MTTKKKSEPEPEQEPTPTESTQPVPTEPQLVPPQQPGGLSIDPATDPMHPGKAAPQAPAPTQTDESDEA